MNRIIKIWNVGTMSYSRALNLQKHLADLHRVSPNNSDSVILVEHPPVYTIGLRSKDYTVEDEHKLTATGAEFFRTNRGGLITFHGPGQLVVYPILNLRNYNAGMKWYICHMEKSVIDLCRKLGLQAETSPHTGVWIGNNKVCAIGVHGSRYVTTHGLAINCNNDLKWYMHIVPCGIKDKGVTTLSKELDRDVTTDEIVPLFLDSFKDFFNCNYVDCAREDSQRVLRMCQ